MPKKGSKKQAKKGEKKRAYVRKKKAVPAGIGTQIAVVRGSEIEVSAIAVCQLPLCEELPSYSNGFRRVDLRLTPSQGRVMERTWKTLRDNHVRLSSGKHIETCADVVRFVFEQLESNVVRPGCSQIQEGHGEIK